MKRVIPLVIIAIGLVSCRYHEGVMTSNATITDKSEIVGFANGTAETTHVFGIGGLDSETLIQDAKNEMYLEYPLTKGQAYANMSFDISRSFYPLAILPIVIKNKAVISADVVELDPSHISDELQPLFIELKENKALALEAANQLRWIQRGDSLLLLNRMDSEKVLVEDIVKGKKVIVIKSDLKKQGIKPSKLFIFKEGAYLENPENKVGAIYETKVYGYKATGMITGINPYGLLLKLNNKLIFIEKPQPEEEEEEEEEKTFGD